MLLLNFETLPFLPTNHQLLMRSAHSKIRISLPSVTGKGICGKERLKKIKNPRIPKCNPARGLRKRNNQAWMNLSGKKTNELVISFTPRVSDTLLRATNWYQGKRIKKNQNIQFRNIKIGLSTPGDFSVSSQRAGASAVSPICTKDTKLKRVT